MHIDMTKARAKTMATTLKNYLDDNPHPKLSRSSAIEAVARMLGYANRNTMLALLPETSQAAPATDASAPETQALASGIDAWHAQMRQTCAHMLVASARKHGSTTPFKQAYLLGEVALTAVEDALVNQIQSHAAIRQLLTAVMAEDKALADIFEAYPSTIGIRPIALASGLVKQSLDLAETLRSGEAPQDAPPRASASATPVPEKHNVAPPPPARSSVFWFSVPLKAWAKASLQVELEGGGVADIEAEVLCIGSIDKCAPNPREAEKDALLSARFDNLSDYMRPAPEQGVRNARWATTDHGDVLRYLHLEEEAIESHWEVDLEALHEPQINGVVT